MGGRVELKGSMERCGRSSNQPHPGAQGYEHWGGELWKKKIWQVDLGKKKRLEKRTRKGEKIFYRHEVYPKVLDQGASRVGAGRRGKKNQQKNGRLKEKRRRPTVKPHSFLCEREGNWQGESVDEKRSGMEKTQSSGKEWKNGWQDCCGKI